MSSGVRNLLAGLTAMVVASGLATGAAQAAVTVAFNDFGPGGSYNGSAGWLVSTSTSYLATHFPIIPEPNHPAMGFTSAASIKVSAIDLAIAQLIGTNSSTLSLWTNSGGQLGAELGSWTLTAYPSGNVTPCCALTTVSGIKGIKLTAGDQYFLQLTGNADDDSLWFANNTGSTGPVLGIVSIYFYRPPPLLAPGTLGAFDVVGTPSGVPEPATWAMMLVGFGGLGVTMRAARRRKTSWSI